MGDVEDGSGPGKWRVKGTKNHKNMRLRNWGAGWVDSSASDLATSGARRLRKGEDRERAGPHLNSTAVSAREPTSRSG